MKKIALILALLVIGIFINSAFAGIASLRELSVELDAACSDVIGFRPLFVDAGVGGYYLVPFGPEPEDNNPSNFSSQQNQIRVVVRIDADDGRLLDVSFVDETVLYIPVSELIARELVIEYLFSRGCVVERPLKTDFLI